MVAGRRGLGGDGARWGDWASQRGERRNGQERAVGMARRVSGRDDASVQVSWDGLLIRLGYGVFSSIAEVA